MVTESHVEFDSIRSLRKKFERGKITAREFEFQSSLFCIVQSIVHGNVTPANEFLSYIKGTKRKKFLAKEVLEKYGKLAFMSGNKFELFYLPNKNTLSDSERKDIESKLRNTFFKSNPKGSAKPLYDESTKRTPMRASKHAKQRPDNP